MVPATLEEQIICYADKFYSKNGSDRATGKNIAAVLNSLEPYGPEKVQRFKAWIDRFEDQAYHEFGQPT